MSYRSEELIPVRSESELRAGMTVVVKPCHECGHVEGVILVAMIGHKQCACCRKTGPTWKLVGGCRDGTFRFCCAVVEGHLFRLDTGIDEKADRRQVEQDRRAAHDAVIAIYTRAMTKLDRP